MNSPTKLVLVLMSLSLLVSCSATRVMPMSHSSTQTDTIYLSNVRFDSVYVSNQVFQDRSRDTVFIRQRDVEYRYRVIRDTVERIKIETVRDSIPYEVRITEVKEVAHTPWPVKLLAWTGAFFLLLLTIWIIRKLS